MEIRVCLIVFVILTVGTSENIKDGIRTLVEWNTIPLTAAGFQGGKPRRKRMSCDMLSYPLPLGYINHAACTSFCIVNGKNYVGHCEFGWCKCK